MGNWSRVSLGCQESEVQVSSVAVSLLFSDLSSSLDYFQYLMQCKPCVNCCHTAWFYNKKKTPCMIKTGMMSTFFLNPRLVEFMDVKPTDVKSHEKKKGKK